METLDELRQRRLDLLEEARKLRVEFNASAGRLYGHVMREQSNAALLQNSTELAHVEEVIRRMEEEGVGIVEEPAKTDAIAILSPHVITAKVPGIGLIDFIPYLVALNLFEEHIESREKHG